MHVVYLVIADMALHAFSLALWAGEYSAAELRMPLRCVNIGVNDPMRFSNLIVLAPVARQITTLMIPNPSTSRAKQDSKKI